MKLSVVMAVRNGDPHIREAIESVLAQSVTDFEFLIVDDASEDDTPEILSAYQNRDSRIRVLRNERNLGPFPSANRALMLARGRFVARHDADDISPPRRFSIQLEALDSDPATVLVTGAVEIFGPNSGEVNCIIWPPSWQPKLEWELLFTNVVGAGAHVMFPRVFRGTQILFPAKYPYAEDYGLWCRLSRLGRVKCPTQVVYRYRQHPLSITSRHKAEQDDCASKMRREYQSHYLRSEVSLETITELLRFWNADGGRPLAGSLRIHAILTDLRSNFLAYIEQRYGPSARTTLEAELEKTLNDRLGYWLYRSMRFLDARACGEMLEIARARRNAANVAGKAIKHVAGGLMRRLS